MEIPNEHVKTILEDIAERHGIKNYHIMVSPGAKDGGNYQGVAFKVCISGEGENGETKVLKLFCKTPQEKEIVRFNMKLNIAFTTESFMLTTVLPGYKDFQDELLIDGGFESFTKIYATNCDEYKEYLIMNDLSADGFEVFDFRKRLDLEHMQLAVRELGKFHGVGFALKEKKPDIYKKYENNVKFQMMKLGPPPELMKLFKTFLKRAIDKLQFSEKYDEKWKLCCENFFQKAMPHSGNTTLIEKYSVIRHGDFWNNNMMFKYENGAPTQICLIDWQMSTHSLPVLDLIGYIFTSTTKSFRAKHYNTLLLSYYNSLSSHLSKLGCDAEKLFPFSIFQEQLKICANYAMLRGIFMQLFNQHDDNIRTAADLLEDPDLLFIDDENTEANYNLIHDIFVDLVDLGYL